MPKKLTLAQLRQAWKRGGKRAARSLTAEQRKARASAGGKAGGRGRAKTGGK